VLRKTHQDTKEGQDSKKAAACLEQEPLPGSASETPGQQEQLCHNPQEAAGDDEGNSSLSLPRTTSQTENSNGEAALRGKAGTGVNVIGNSEAAEVGYDAENRRPGAERKGVTSSLFATLSRMSLPHGIVGAMNSKDVPADVGGIRILHNPRAAQNLEVTGGLEVSRQQLAYLRPTTRESGNEDNANANVNDEGDGGHLENVVEGNEENE